MMPTILDSDVVLIDTSQKTPRLWDQLWAVDMGGMGMIKRLRPTKDGTGMVLVSSNPDVPDETAYDGEMNIVGRVVAIMRKT
jgi:phage repressor protein C with HTH and peptisase S24 domain